MKQQIMWAYLVCMVWLVDICQSRLGFNLYTPITSSMIECINKGKS